VALLELRRLAGLLESALSHLEGGEALHEEVRAGRGDTLDFLRRRGCPQGLGQDGVMHAGQVEQAQPSGHGLAPELVRRLQPGLAGAHQMAPERGGVVGPELLEVGAHLPAPR
jgi:hypothetical protein